MLEQRGYTMFYSKNHWPTDPEYKGINTRWRTPDGVRFEVQFHTPESFHAKQELTHKAYERIRNPVLSDDERGTLITFQRTIYSSLELPPGSAEIEDR